MVKALNEPFIDGPALAAQNAPLMPGWHRIQGEIACTKTTAAGTCVATIEAVVSHVAVVISGPALSRGKGSFVVMLERAAGGVAMFADRSVHGLVVVTMSVTRH